MANAAYHIQKVQICNESGFTCADVGVWGLEVERRDD